MSQQPPGADHGDLGPAAGTARCPSCAARVSPGQPWCTLCHLRLGEPVRSVDEPVAPPAAEPAGPSPTEEVRPQAGPTPQAVPGEQPLAPTVLPPGVAEAMLAELAATTDRPLAGGPLAGRSRAVRTVLVVSAALVLTAVGVGLLALIGLLL